MRVLLHTWILVSTINIFLGSHDLLLAWRDMAIATYGLPAATVYQKTCENRRRCSLAIMAREQGRWRSVCRHPPRATGGLPRRWRLAVTCRIKLGSRPWAVTLKSYEVKA